MIFDDLGLLFLFNYLYNKLLQYMAEEKLALQAILTCCANRTTNVPMYAYAFGLLAFGPSLPSDCR